MPPKAIDKQVDVFPFMENFEWKSVYELSYKIIKEPYLQSFQYKLLNRVINCKDKIFVWKISENNRCIYCTKVDTIEHHFVERAECELFWSRVMSWSRNNLETSTVPTICDILFGIPIREENIDYLQ